MTDILNGHNFMLDGIKKTLGKELMNRISSSKILVVGAGGIGCELLKNLALSGFNNVEVIDLDTIDVSNLNRQFLFRREHVGMPKCEVACLAATKMFPAENPESAPKYLAHHGNVFDNSRFNVQFFKSFNLVLNALDNIEARRRVNRLCLAANIPLIEAGTTGYLGQVTVIDKSSNVECYDCQPKPTQKVYPICTIRSTPSMPVHVIVWAKEFYKLLFNPKVEESMLFEDQSGDEKSTFMDIVLQLRDELANANDVKIRDTIGQLLIALYNTEIQKQLDMDRFKTAKKVPSPIPVDSFTKMIVDQDSIAPSKRSGYKHTDIWSKDDCISEAISCIMEASKILREGGSLLPEFDKDDDLAMRFVTCTSNLRSYVFGIEPIQSHYSAKGIAGNIIPAIATTNAIVAGLQVLQAFQILAKQMENKTGELKDCCRFVYCLRDKTRQGYYLQPTSLPSPNPKCFVCRSAVLQLTLDTNKWTFETMLKRIIKKELGFTEPSVNIGSSIIYEEGDDIDDDEYAAIIVKSLVDLPAGGMKDGTIITIEDFTQDLEVDVCINHKGDWEKKDADDEVGEEDQFIIGGDKPVAGKCDQENDQLKNDEDENDDGIVIVDDEDISNTVNSKKRGLSDDDDDDIIEVVEEPSTKKTRLSD